MLRVYYSNQTEKLLEALMERMREHRGSFYERVSIVVPNQNMETYLKLALARETGICANVEFKYPRDLVESLRDGRAWQLALEDCILTALFDDELLKTLSSSRSRVIWPRETRTAKAWIYGACSLVKS